MPSLYSGMKIHAVPFASFSLERHKPQFHTWSLHLLSFMETKITSIFGIVEHVAPTRAGLEKQVNWLLNGEYSSSTEHDRNIRMQRGSITTIYTYSTALYHLCFFKTHSQRQCI